MFKKPDKKDLTKQPKALNTDAQRTDQLESRSTWGQTTNSQGWRKRDAEDGVQRDVETSVHEDHTSPADSATSHLYKSYPYPPRKLFAFLYTKFTWQISTTF